MDRYSIFFLSGTAIVVITYLFIFVLPGNRLSQDFQSDYYSGAIPRIFPVFLIFGDVFVVTGLLFPDRSMRRNRIMLLGSSAIFIIAGSAMALLLKVSPVNTSQYNGIRSGYLIVEGLSILFFTMVISYYKTADTKNTDIDAYGTHDR
ncbi:MAG: hypothetical protein RE471_09365 [Ferroplasma sp.]|uniref:hypothetical protein n=1 Tax=Ferroplasma sp. TaxID=2591003 RepID=UPI002814A3B9|nr:hypothetical protein [Ferroplasma sp.]WMT51173.1 MAG: hypothetical protein RE471_09365 [Ferroplasma sp.]